MVGQLKRMSDQMDKQIAKAEREKKGYKYEVTETKLLNELECLEKTVKVLEKEVEILKQKVETDCSYLRIDLTEKEYQQNKKRNEDLMREIKIKEKDVKKNDKRIRELENIAGGIDSVKEEGIIMKLLFKENCKSEELERKITQNFTNIGQKDNKSSELTKKVQEITKELEELKNTAQVTGANIDISKENQANEKNDGAQIEILKSELTNLQDQLEEDQKESAKTKSEIQIEIDLMKIKLKELEYVFCPILP